MTNNKTIYQVDAFTDKAFKGNPAGVMILDTPLSDAFMQNMAAEMNLSETAYVVPNNNGFDIRYFTPTVEIPLCGHATLASAHVMYEKGIVDVSQSINFKAKGGDLVIKKEGAFIVMTFPQYALKKVAVPKEFNTFVGFEPLAMYESDYDWKIAVAENQNDIEKSEPNFEALKSNGLGHLMITSRGNKEDIDFVVRCFAPSSGINEDPVTGSAYSALTPLWANKLGKKQMNSHQVSKRKGELKIVLDGHNIQIKGVALTIFEAYLQI